MQTLVLAPLRLAAAWIILGVMMCPTAVAAESDWGADFGIYGWLPIIEVENEAGHKSKITRDDLLDNIDLFGFSFVRLHKGKWSFHTDFVYFNVSKQEDVPLFGKIPDLAELDKAGMQAWVIRPAIGFEIHRSDKQFVELYAGARYLWIEADLKFDLNPTLPELPSGSRKASPSESNWDGIVGVRGSYDLTDNWFIPYSVNAGTGESDFTLDALAGVGYRFRNVNAVAGWRYLYFDIGSDTAIKELSANGPFAGVVFDW